MFTTLSGPLAFLFQSAFSSFLFTLLKTKGLVHLLYRGTQSHYHILITSSPNFLFYVKKKYPMSDEIFFTHRGLINCLIQVKHKQNKLLTVKGELCAAESFFSLLQSFDLPVRGIGPGLFLHTALEFHKVLYWLSGYSFLSFFPFLSILLSTLILSDGQRETT